MSAHDATEREAELTRLAALSAGDYETERRAAASRLGMRLAALDEEVKRRRAALSGDEADAFPDWKIEPWPEPVEVDALLDELVGLFRRFSVLPEGAVEALALWTLHAWAHDAAFHSPILALTSPQMRCGKTTVLALLARLTPRPLMASNITGPVIYRAVEKWEPTFLIDEADTFFGTDDAIRGILDSGHRRDGAYVVRNVTDSFEPRRFRTWCPKAVAKIGALAATLADRSIIIPLRRKTPHERTETLATAFDGDFLAPRRRAARWSADAVDRLRG
ncbi:MAG: hypothetical protein K8I02_00205, partial [Candidatus Methylomirabilis sp.]|nr:hypothetical protein [Deltaproteobacteria bacterium]